MSLPDVQAFLHPPRPPRGLRRKREIARLNRELALAKALLAVDGRQSFKLEIAPARGGPVEDPRQKSDGVYGSWSPGQLEPPPPTEAELEAVEQAKRTEQMRSFRRSILAATIQAARLRGGYSPWSSSYWRGNAYSWSSFYWR